jgi:chromosome segregation ATPase
MREFQDQNASNQRGIDQLAASIAGAKEDIRDFTEHLQRLEPKIQEYEQLKAEHQKSEEEVVTLSDEFETVRKKVDTESLTANVRRQIDSGNRTIADLNRQIDQVLNKGSVVQDKIRAAKMRIADLEGRVKRTKAETQELQSVGAALTTEKRNVRLDLKQCRREEQTIGGENEIVFNELRDGVDIQKEPWQIRKELLTLKAEVKELSAIEVNQVHFETALGQAVHPVSLVPLRKRLRLIPSENKWP